MTVADPARPALRLSLRIDRSFGAFGSTVRLIADGSDAARAFGRARAEMLDYHRRLSRFRAGSELCTLNADPRAVVPASALLRSAVRAGLWAARMSEGLVDPCLLDALEAAGYARSYQRSTDTVLPIGPVLAARPDPRARWRAIGVDDDAGVIVRPSGLRLDLGGSGKGHVADLVSRHFTGCRDWVVDCGGDVLVGAPRAIEIAHPMRRGPATCVHLDRGAVATSSVVSRAWRDAKGRHAHHLLDPRTGRPVRSGLLSVSAIAPSTLHAETLAKVGLLRGAATAREVLGAGGGVLVHEDGEVETVGALT